MLIDEPEPPDQSSLFHQSTLFQNADGCLVIGIDKSADVPLASDRIRKAEKAPSENDRRIAVGG